MKIAFVGKGGAGKTTLAALFARFLVENKAPVLAIDADINQHLGRTLGLSYKESYEVPPLGIEIDKIKEYLRGTNELIPDNSSMIKTTPPGPGSRFLSLQGRNPIYNYFSRMIDGVRFMAVGTFDEEDIGIKCYHSKTGSVELILNHLIDKEHEYILVDMTAGADSFASGLFTRFDMTFLIVEPTHKSIGVYEQYQHYAKKYDVTIKVIGNKIENQDDIDFLRKNIGKDLLTMFPISSFVKKTDKGMLLPISKLEKQNRKALKDMVDVVDLQEKDWSKFYRQDAEFHIKNAESWANQDTGKDLTKQIFSPFIEHPENYIDAPSV